MKFLKNRTVLGIACIVISILICFGLFPSMVNKINERETYIVAKDYIPKGTLIKDDMLKRIEIGSYNMPNNIIDKENLIVGKYTTADIYKGEFFVSEKLSPIKDKNNQYLYDIPSDKLAISVLLPSFATGLSGKLQPGDIVSIISNAATTYIPDELQYVEVLAVTTAKGTDITEKDQNNNVEKEVIYETVTLLVDRKQALVLTKINQLEHIHVALVSRGNEERKEMLLKEQEKILMESDILE